MSNPSLTRALNLFSYNTETINGVTFYVAENLEQHKAGLSGLASLDKDGMLFIFDAPTSKPFHMDGMSLDLDISFYNETGNLLKQATYSKLYRGPIFSPSPYKYVTETPSGTVDLSKLDMVQHLAKKETASMSPPAAARAAAKQAIAWHAEGYAGGGFQPATLARAKKIAAGESLTLDHVKRMKAFFDRHSTNSDKPKFVEGRDGKRPAPWYFAWQAWGGSSGWRWATSVVNAENKKVKQP